MKKYAVLIGNELFPNEPDKKWHNLKCAKNDITELEKLLINAEIGGFDDVEVLPDKTTNDILWAIENVFHKATIDDLILIYYSGHGVQAETTGKLYLSANNTVFDRPASTAVAMAQIRAIMDIKSSRKKVILILDCCYSGDAGKDFTNRGGTDAELAQELAEQAKGIYLLAAAGSTVAVEGKRHGLFTKYLLEGIKTGDADEGSDGYIDIHELFNYIRPRVEQERPRQEPRFYGMGETGGRLIISKSGCDSRKDRAEKIRLFLLELEIQHEGIAEIKTEALAIARTERAKLSPVQLQKDQLLTDLLDKKIPLLTFDRAWNKTASPSKDWQSLLRKIASPKIWSALIIVPVITLSALSHDWQAETPEQQLKKAQAWMNGNDEKKYSLAVELLKPLVNAGNTNAMNLLAHSYYFGTGVKKDEAHGCQLYKQAIDANNTDKKGFYDKACIKS